ncbi:MAG: tyrosine-type recombinase/integrase [Planctomycetota bacterium]
MAKKSAENAWVGNPYKRPNSPFWHIVYDDEAGVTRRKSTRTKDKRVAQDFLAETLREIGRRKLGHVDPFAEWREVPLSRLIAEYREHMSVEQRAPRYVRETVRQLRAFVSFAKVGTIPSITAPGAERWLESIRKKRAAKTRDHHASALRGFGRWLERTGRWDRNPFQSIRVRTPKRDRHRVFKRVGFTFSEAEQLVEAAWARFEAERVYGGVQAQKGYDEKVRDRQVLYWFVLTTGFRASECASIRWEDVSLDGDKPCVRLAGDFTKNGDDARIPLQGFVAEALRAMRTRRSESQVRRYLGPVQETDHVFQMPDKPAELVRKDAAFAGLIPQKSPTSKRVDFHALRKSCARILIEMQVHPKVIQQVLRHSDIRLTMDLYGELGEDDLFRELPGTFPVPRMFGEAV